MENAITKIKEIKVGHWTDFEAKTGCTVVLCEKGAIAGVDIRGSASGTREIDCLRPGHLVDKVHAICISGGSAFGLDSAGGVMKYLEEKKIGFFVGKTHIPIVPCAIIFDLGVGRSDIRPDKESGYKACLDAKDDFKVGNIGAGCGATVGKIFGIEYSSKGGVGTSCIELDNGVLVGALAVVNAFGDVIDDKTGKILAGAKDPETKNFANTELMMKQGKGRSDFIVTNTTIGVIVTNVKLNKLQITKVAQVAHNGLAKVIKPAHTMFDGDTIFALSYGEKIRDVNTIALCAEEAIASAIKNAVTLTCEKSVM